MREIGVKSNGTERPHDWSTVAGCVGPGGTVRVRARARRVAGMAGVGQAAVVRARHHRPASPDTTARHSTGSGLDTGEGTTRHHINTMLLAIDA